jgi:2-polyprenyl-3-methyl-5-hydroxy-6-metoxy-1,4-benzoquinol methylase
VSAIDIISRVQEIQFPSEWYGMINLHHFWFQWRLAAALNQIRESGIPVDENLRVLEVGAGTGVLRDQLEAATRWTVDITELNLEALRAARPGRGRSLYYDILEERESFVESYDVIVLYDLVEHIPDTHSFLRAALRHLKPGGYLLINVPALQSLFSTYDTVAGHLRRYDRESLRGELHGTDVTVLDVRYWGLTLVPLLVARKVLLALRPPTPDVIRSGFVPPGPLVHAALRVLMRVETAVIRRPPLGTSVLLSGRKGSPARP